MDATKHIRILAWVYLALSAPVFLLSVAVCFYAANTGGEGALIFLPAAMFAAFSAPVLAAGIGLYLRRDWGLVVAVLCAVPMLLGIVLSPLGAYTLFVAYHWWRAPRPPAPVVEVGPQITAFVERLTWPTKAWPHLRILGSAWILLAILPLYLGLVLLIEGLSKDAGSPGVIAYQAAYGAGSLVLAVLVLAIARGLLQRRMWAVIIAALAAAPLLLVTPLGTFIALYSLYVGWLVWRERNAPVIGELPPVDG